MSTTRSRPGSTGSASSGFLQDVPGAFPQPSSPVASNSQSLSQAVYARRAEFTRPKRIKIKVGTWNTAAFKGTEKDVGGWFIDGKGVTEHLTGLRVSSPNEPHKDEIPDSSALDEREDVESQESRYKRKSCTLPENDPGLVPGGDEVGLYVLGLQEVVDVNSATEALRPYTDPSVAQKWKASIEGALPPGYQIVAEQQLIGLLILIYASKDVIPDIRSVSTTSVGTGLMGYMGNKGAVTARIVLGETTRLVFINCHLAAGTDKGAVERRNWDFGQIVSRTKFEPIQDSMGLSQTSGEMIGDEDVAFVMGDLNYRLEGIPGDDVRRLLMLHTRNEYDLSQLQKVDSELDKAKARIEGRSRSSTTSTTSSAPSMSSKGDVESQHEVDEADFASIVEDRLEPSDDPASLQTTLASLLPHDELQQQQKTRKAFHDGWKEGPITFLPTYKYDVGSVGVFDSSEKRRAPSWCDRILFRTRRDKLQYESMITEEAESRKKDEEMKTKGMDEAGKDEEVLYDYDPDEDADEDESYDDYTDAPPGVVVTKEGFEDELHLEYYTAHQRVLSSDHKPLDAVFSLKYDAVVPELKAKVHQEVARELDKAENETRPSVTVVVDRHHSDPREVSDDVPEKFEGVSFGDVRYAQRKHRSLTIANTGRVAATVHFIDRPVGPGQSPGIAPMWLQLKMDDQHLSRKSEGSTGAGTRHLDPGDTCSVELEFRVLDLGLARALNEGIKQVEDILVLRVEAGRDHFIPVRGNWLESSLGHSINKLIRIPEGGIRKLQHQKPDGSRSRDSAVDEQQPVKWSAPRELFRLTEAIEDLTVRSTAEWEMMAHEEQDKPPWNRVAGWPFAEDSWTVSDTDKRNDNLAAICDAVDTDSPFEKCLPPETTHLQRLESLAEFLLLFLRSLPDGVVKEELWAQVDKGMLQNEKEHRNPSKEEQRTWIQEILSQSPAHSISFILLTSMLDRIISEVATASKSSNDNKTAAEAPQAARAMGLIRRKTATKDPAAAHRQMNVLALASIFGEVSIRAASMPPKGKERSALENRKTGTIELFLTREDA